MNTRKDIIPNNLKEYRLKAGLTQKQVAKKLGFTNEVSICHREQGKNIPSLSNLFKIAFRYRATPCALFESLNQKLERDLLRK